jgi:cytochrome P450
MTYLSRFIQEALRIEPSVNLSSQIYTKDTIKLGKFNLLKGTLLMINMYAMHHDKS